MIRIIARRELRERALKKGYLLGTAVTLIIVIAAIVLPTVLGGDGDTRHRIGVVGGDADVLAQMLGTVLPPGHAVETIALTEEVARQSVLAGDVDVAMIDSRQLVVDGAPHPILRGALDGVVRQQALVATLTEEGLAPDAIERTVGSPAPLEIVDLSGDDGDSAFMIAFLATILLVVGVQMSGATLLSGALEEKSSRVVEILVSAARPWQLLAGKVLATSLLAVIQLVLIVSAALAANAAVDAFPLPAVTGSVLTIGVIMLLAGFAFYAALFTVAGTLASSMEDAQSTAGPLYFAMWGAYAAVFITVLPNPDGVMSQILTFLPPTAPFIVPARVAIGDVATWHVAASVVITLAGALVALRVAGRIYAASLLSGGRLTWRAAWKAEPIR